MVVEVKICGLTRPEDAAVAAASGATYLGVVFAGGPRVVSAGTARAVGRAAPGLRLVGVFGEQPVEEILRLRDDTGLSGAQLHGTYTAEQAARLRAQGMLVWRVVRLATETDLGRLAEATREADAVLVEPMIAGVRGGAGVALTLPVAVQARERLRGRRMVLAGGLTPDTVAAAAGLVGPEVVDVSSGVEILPGIKDPDMIVRFVEAARGSSPVV